MTLMTFLPPKSKRKVRARPHTVAYVRAIPRVPETRPGRPPVLDGRIALGTLNRSRYPDAVVGSRDPNRRLRAWQ